MRVGVLVNPRARRILQRPGLVSAIRQAVDGGARVRVTGGLTELADVAREWSAWGAERVVLCGGDGTLMAAASHLAQAYPEESLPELCVAPAGTVATVSKNWGQRAGLLQTVRQATRASRGHQSKTPTLRVDTAAGARVGFIFGSGLVARFFERYYAAGGRGLGTAARIVGRVFIGSFLADEVSRGVLEPLPCRLLVDGEEHAARAFSLIVSAVVQNLGLGMRVTYRAAEDPRRPHLIATPLGPRKLGPQAPRVVLGRPIRGEGCVDALIGSFELRFTGGAGPWVLDGDLFSSDWVRVEAGPCFPVVTF